MMPLLRWLFLKALRDAEVKAALAATIPMPVQAQPTVYEIKLSGADSADFERIVAAIDKGIEERAINAVLNACRRGALI